MTSFVRLGVTDVKSFFVIGNPNHHVAMMAPVMRELVARGHAVDVLSLCALRGMAAPKIDIEGVHVHDLFPRGIRRRPALGAQSGGGKDRMVRGIAREALWRTALGPALRWQMLWLPDVVVLPNDAAFPYDRINARCISPSRVALRPTVRTVLLQEGIRFPLPAEARSGLTYGAGGCARVCAWGEASAEHFVNTGAPRDSVVVTGNARFDDVDVEGIRAPANIEAVRARHGLTDRTVLYLSNPVDDQGFMSTDAKMRLFADFLARAGAFLDDADAMIAVKLHPREDVAAFRAVASRARTPSGRAAPVKVIEDAPLFPLLAAARAAVVLSSTVGLEALLFDVPLGVLALPGYGPVHDYVRSGAAERLDTDEHLAMRLRTLFEGKGPPADVRAAYVDRHLAHRGDAATRVADVVTSVVGGAGRMAHVSSGR